MRIKVLYLAFLSFFISSCADVSVSKKEAIDKFITKAESETKLYDAIKEEPAPKKQLIKFTYGPDSLKDITFLEYLAQSNANLEASLIKDLKVQEDKFRLNEKNTKNPTELFLAKIATYKKLLNRVQVNYTDLSLKQSLEGLCRNAQLQCEVNIATDKKIRENNSGSLWQIFSQLSKKNNLVFSLSMSNMATLNFSSSTKPDTSLIGELKLSQDLYQGIQYEKEILSDLNKLNDGIKDSSEVAYKEFDGIDLKTTEAKTMLQQFTSDLNESSYENERNKEASFYRNQIISQSKNIFEAENKYGKTVSNLDPKTKPGSELIIQKFSIYNQKPDDLGKSLKSYSLFNKPGCTQLQTKNTNQNNTNQTNVSPPPANNVAINNKSSLPSDNIVSSNQSPVALDSTSALQQTNQQNNNCLTLDIESDGVVATGTIQDVKILEKFLGDQDKPLKQVMIEAYILEVNNDWASKIQSKIANAGGSVLSVAGMNTVPALSSGLKFSTTFGSNSEITALINLIETNSLGRKISNPVILVQDGQTGVVNKTRTVYEVLTTTVPGAVGTNNTITQEAKPLESPLKLSVTPTVNKHNDNISLKFDFTETIRDSDTYTAPTTANTITTTLNVEPGAVVMMAGLRKETNAITSNGAPIISKYGLGAIFAPLTAIFGGENSRSTSGSELLVLINPTVITSKGLKNTIEKAK